MPKSAHAQKAAPLGTIYTSGTYLQLHPEWHTEESPWKAAQILRMLEKRSLTPHSVVDVGCGAGEVLRQLQQNLGADCDFRGYDISPQAIELAKQRENEHLHFAIADFRKENTAPADLLLMMNVLEHIEDRFGYLRDIKERAEYKLFHVLLNLSVQTVMRKNGLIHVRERYGIVNYFTKELLLQTLRDAGYEIVDYFYTTGSTDLPSREFNRNLLRIPRKMLFAVNQDLAARVLGGYRIMVLAK